MSIFESLKNAIFGSHAQAAAKPAPSPSPAPQTTAAQPAPAPIPANVGHAAPAGAAAGGPVDIAAVLNQKAATKQEKLNWQTSIVDLMKLVDLDSSLANRKALAKELGYTGNMEDSASMNIWLHKEVMTRLAASGGKVPDSLKH
jgi:3-oxoacyl-ACP reductase-like protein